MNRGNVWTLCDIGDAARFDKALTAAPGSLNIAGWSYASGARAGLIPAQDKKGRHWRIGEGSDSRAAPPLHYATCRGSLPCVLVALEHGANPSATVDGKTAADVAASLGHADIAKLIRRSIRRAEDPSLACVEDEETARQALRMSEQERWERLWSAAFSNGGEVELTVRCVATAQNGGKAKLFKLTVPRFINATTLHNKIEALAQMRCTVSFSADDVIAEDVNASRMGLLTALRRPSTPGGGRGKRKSTLKSVMEELSGKYDGADASPNTPAKRGSVHKSRRASSKSNAAHEADRDDNNSAPRPGSGSHRSSRASSRDGGHGGDQHDSHDASHADDRRKSSTKNDESSSPLPPLHTSTSGSPQYRRRRSSLQLESMQDASVESLAGALAKPSAAELQKQAARRGQSGANHGSSTVVDGASDEDDDGPPKQLQLHARNVGRLLSRARPLCVVRPLMLTSTASPLRIASPAQLLSIPSAQDHAQASAAVRPTDAAVTKRRRSSKTVTMNNTGSTLSNTSVSHSHQQQELTNHSITSMGSRASMKRRQQSDMLSHSRISDGLGVGVMSPELSYLPARKKFTLEEMKAIVAVDAAEKLAKIQGLPAGAGRGVARAKRVNTDELVRRLHDHGVLKKQQQREEFDEILAEQQKQLIRTGPGGAIDDPLPDAVEDAVSRLYVVKAPPEEDDEGGAGAEEDEYDEEGMSMRPHVYGGTPISPEEAAEASQRLYTSAQKKKEAVKVLDEKLYGAQRRKLDKAEQQRLTDSVYERAVAKKKAALERAATKYAPVRGPQATITRDQLHESAARLSTKK